MGRGRRTSLFGLGLLGGGGGLLLGESNGAAGFWIPSHALWAGVAFYDMMIHELFAKFP